MAIEYKGGKQRTEFTGRKKAPKVRSRRNFAEPLSILASHLLLSYKIEGVWSGKLLFNFIGVFFEMQRSIA